jgi:hypothetical protein
MPLNPPLTVNEILEKIANRLKVLGNKTHSKKTTDDEKLRATYGSRELAKLRDWINDNQ